MKAQGKGKIINIASATFFKRAALHPLHDVQGPGAVGFTSSSLARPPRVLRADFGISRERDRARLHPERRKREEHAGRKGRQANVGRGC